MEFTEILKFIFQYGGTVIMAGLFIWVFIQDRTKNNQLLANNTAMLEALTESNNNIAKSLDIISSNLIKLDSKVDRNYETILKKEGKLW